MKASKRQRLEELLEGWLEREKESQLCCEESMKERERGKGILGIRAKCGRWRRRGERDIERKGRQERGLEREVIFKRRGNVGVLWWSTLNYGPMVVNMEEGAVVEWIPLDFDLCNVDLPRGGSFQPSDDRCK